MNPRFLYEKELNKLRMNGLPLNNIELTIDNMTKGFRFIIRIEERYFNNSLIFRLENLNYRRINRLDSKIFPLKMNEIINAQARGKILNNFNKTINYVVFEKNLNFEDLKEFS